MIIIKANWGPASPGYQDIKNIKFLNFTELLEEHPTCHLLQNWFSIFLTEPEEREDWNYQRIKQCQHQQPDSAGFLFTPPQQGIEEHEELRQQVES